MTAASLFKPNAHNGLQPVDLGRHLGSIANLIELCFGAEMDAGGRSLIREMQLLARAGPAMRLLQMLTLQKWKTIPPASWKLFCDCLKKPVRT